MFQLIRALKVAINAGRLHFLREKVKEKARTQHLIFSDAARKSLSEPRYVDYRMESGVDAAVATFKSKRSNAQLLDMYAKVSKHIYANGYFKQNRCRP